MRVEVYLKKPQNMIVNIFIARFTTGWARLHLYEGLELLGEPLFVFRYRFGCSLISRGVLPYMGYIGMRRCEGYGFQDAYSGVGYINERVWV